MCMCDCVSFICGGIGGGVWGAIGDSENGMGGMCVCVCELLGVGGGVHVL